MKGRSFRSIFAMPVVQILLFLTLLIFFSCRNAPEKTEIQSLPQDAKRYDIKLDTNKQKASKLVLEVKLCGEGSGNKFIWEQAIIESVIRNKSNYKLPDTISIAHYSWLEGLPENQACIVYLVPFPLGSSEPFDMGKWILLEGNGLVGVDSIEHK